MNTATLPPILPQKSIRKASIWDILWSIFWITMLIFLGLKIFVFQQVTVVGESMFPNYYTGELLLVNKLDRNIQRGQVVAVYEDPRVAKNADYWTPFQNRIYLKRIIGLPGESIEMMGSKVIIYSDDSPQGKILSEDYIDQTIKDKEDATRYHYKKTRIAANTFFVLGDNRTNSTDSRIKGAFPDYSIFGQESMRFWPSARIGVFDRPKYEYKGIDEITKSQLTEANSLQTVGKYESIIN